MQTFLKQISCIMPVKIRLARHGKKRYAHYSIVVADSRAPRDGKFIEKLGTYNPNTNPATIILDFDKALHWLQTGAQPTDTCRAILSYKGVLYKNHLQIGVKKEAITQEQADEKFEQWLKEKEAKIQSKIDRLSDEAKSEAQKIFEREKKIKEERAAELAKKNSELVEEEGEGENEENKEEGENTEEVVATENNEKKAE